MEYLFYLLVKVLLKINKRHPDPIFTAVGFLSLFQGLNILTVVFLLKSYGLLNYSTYPLAIGLTVILFSINYCFFNFKEKGNLIIEKYDDSNQKLGMTRNFVFSIFYILFSFISCMYVAYLNSKRY